MLNNATARPARDVPLWVPGDWNAFFGLFTNVLLNVLVLTGLVLGVVKLPNDVVFGRILPALGIALPLGNLWYAYLAYQMAKREHRTDVAAMPYGPSVPHMFIVVFGVMLPIYLQTNDPIRAWQAGLAWCFIIGVIILIGAFVGPTIRKYTPRAAMLGALAGISIAFISLRPAFQSWDVPWVAFVSLTLVLIGWTAGIRLPGNIPAGLAAVIVGTALGWATGIMKAPDVAASFGQVGLHLPLPSGDVVVGFGAIASLLATAIPLGIYNFTEGMNNVESAAAAGDNYPLRNILLADGIGAIVGSFLGSPFPPAVYIGHPGWKAVGGRIGYSLATGVLVAVVCWLGLAALLLAIIPLVAILPILLYIGLVIGAQAFQASPARHAPAVVLALLPNIASWGQSQVETTLATAGTNLTPELQAKLSDGGAILYHGMVRFGGGATLGA
jgi:adenine/guanine/hypoxanthine permease